MCGRNAAGTTTEPYGYDSQRLDAASGLYQLRAREYDPTTGRFTSPDTAPVATSNPIELDRYAYAAENPINNADPSGQGLTDEAGIYASIARIAQFVGLMGADLGGGVYRLVILLAATCIALGQICLDLLKAAQQTLQAYQLLLQLLNSLNLGSAGGSGGGGGGGIGAGSGGGSGGGAGTGIPRYLYHYTEAANVGSIFAYGLNASIPQPGNPNNAAFGPGQYFTDLTPDEASTGTMFQVAAALFKFPFFWGGKRRSDIVAIKINVSDLPIIRVHSLWTRTFGDRSIFLNPTLNTLSLRGRAGAGSVTFIDFK